MESLEPKAKNSNASSLQIAANLNRRKFLKLGAAGVAFSATAASANAGLATRRSRRTTRRTPRKNVRPFQPIDPTLLRLVNRVSMGFNREIAAEAAALGYSAFLESQLDHLAIDDSVWQAQLATYGFDTISSTSQVIWDNYSAANLNVPIEQLIRATLLRASFSKRQLFERMVEFWTDHFNIEIVKGHCRWLKTADDRDVMRQNALTTFPDILLASAHSAAMSFYLDNWTNVAGHAQENYAREVMELHSMGVDGGFTQKDVEEVARCFTGWGFFFPNSNRYGDFLFNAAAHDNGEKIVLGQTIPAGGGITDGETVLNIISNHPSTARFIAKKLCVRFLGYNPPEDIVESTRVAYLTPNASGKIGDIKQMLRVILSAPAMTYLYTPKLKRPFHLLASIFRATGASVGDSRIIDFFLQQMGHLTFFWPTPDGYPDTLEAWGESVLGRWQVGTTAFVAEPFVTIDTQALLNSEGGNQPGQQAIAIDQIMTGGALSAQEVTLIQNFYDNQLVPAVGAIDSFGLAATVPGFQWY